MIECLSLQNSHVFKATGNREPDRVGCCRLSELRKYLLLGAEGGTCPIAGDANDCGGSPGSSRSKTTSVGISVDKFSPTPWPIPTYTGWWHGHIGVSSLPKATTQWYPLRIQTRDLWIASPLACQWRNHVTECSVWPSENILCTTDL